MKKTNKLLTFGLCIAAVSLYHPAEATAQQYWMDATSYNAGSPTNPLNWIPANLYGVHPAITVTPGLISGTGFNASDLSGLTFAAAGMDNTNIPGVGSGLGEGLRVDINATDDYWLSFTLSSAFTVPATGSFGVFLFDLDTSERVDVLFANGTTVIDPSAGNMAMFDAVLPGGAVDPSFSLSSLAPSGYVSTNDTLSFQGAPSAQVMPSAGMALTSGTTFDRVLVHVNANGSNGAIGLSIGTAVVPEPAGALLLGSAGTLALFRRRRRASC